MRVSSCRLMEKPDVEFIEGLSPAISIEQKTSSHNPRSTVGTVTEIYDYLRLLFARIGEPRCPEHHVPGRRRPSARWSTRSWRFPRAAASCCWRRWCRIARGSFTIFSTSLHAQGFLRARIDGTVTELSDPPELKKNFKHDIEVVVDRLVMRPGNQQRLAESFETALALADDIAEVA
jgi:excinuclease ABC subunit A